MIFRRGPKALDVATTEALARSGELVLVDVRGDAERLASRPPHSRHIALGELQARVTELPADRRVAFVCGHGTRSALAARTAAAAGIDAVNVRGGLSAWSKAGLPLESGPENPTRTRSHT